MSLPTPSEVEHEVEEAIGALRAVSAAYRDAYGSGEVEVLLVRFWRRLEALRVRDVAYLGRYLGRFDPLGD